MLKNPLMQHLRYMLRNRGRQLKPKNQLYLLKESRELYIFYKYQLKNK